MHFKCTTADATVGCVSSATNPEPPPQADLLDMLGSQSFLPIISVLYVCHWGSKTALWLASWIKEQSVSREPKGF